jgi:hypothetical protein
MGSQQEVDMTRRRGNDSGRTKQKSGRPPQPTEMQRSKRTRDERPEREKQRQNDPDAIERNDTKSH